MNRNTAVTVWREVCGNDTVMTMPPTGKTLEEFARRIEAKEREACARVCEAYQVPVGNSRAGEIAVEMTMGALREVRDAIRLRHNAELCGALGRPLE